MSFPELKELIKKNFDFEILLGEDPLDSEVKYWISTGWSLLDAAIGGGLPVGRCVELYGVESTGKSTLSLQAMVNCQQQGGVVVLFEPESTFNKEYSRDAFGLDLSKLILLPSKTALEDAFSCFMKIIESVRQNKEWKDVPILLVWDTLAATPTKKEIDVQEDSGRMTPQYRAQVIRKGMRAITTQISESSVCLLILNHVYQSIGSIPGIVTIETPGGKGVKFHSSVRIQLRRVGWVKESGQKEPIGANVLARIDKNKLGPPRREVVSRLLFGQGFVDELAIFDYASDHGIISKSGSWYTYKPDDGKALKFQANKYMERISEQPELFDEIKKKSIEHFLRKVST